MEPNYEKAATMAAESLIRFGIGAAPVLPLPMLKQMPGVLVVSFTQRHTREITKFTLVQERN